MAKRTIIFKNKPVLVSTATIGGPKEGTGPLGTQIDDIIDDDTFGEESFEKAECKMLSHVIREGIKNAKIENDDVGSIIAGDLLNQIISSSFACRDFNIPYIGVYNACSTMSEAFAIGGMLIDGGYMKNVVCATCSHFSTAERQYRYPLELGSTRPPLSQWTVTGAGAGVLSDKGNGPKITMATFGRVIDFGVTDANNMGAAMAPAAVDTLIAHFKETGNTPDNYDLIITGDLGAFGSRIFKDLMWEKGYNVDKQHVDCGEMIYNICEEEFQGGSGAGCSAVVFNSFIYKKLKKKMYKRVLLMATGALLSTTSTQQGESIPAICHAVVFES